MKKTFWLAMLVALTLVLGSVGMAQAEILPPSGMGQIGFRSAVLCEALTLRQSPNTAASAVETLKYGDTPIVIEESDGWAYVTLGDSEDSTKGWVNADYLVIDPAWFRTEAKTPVYAWNDTSAPKVALLNPNTTLPVLKQEGEWLIVSLRGATGWIYNGAH